MTLPRGNMGRRVATEATLQPFGDEQECVRIGLRRDAGGQEGLVLTENRSREAVSSFRDTTNE